MPTFVLFSHDGYGLGHVRRNTLIARALLQLEPRAQAIVFFMWPARLAGFRLATFAHRQV